MSSMIRDYFVEGIEEGRKPLELAATLIREIGDVLSDVADPAVTLIDSSDEEGG